MKFNYKSRKGFTLIELLVVIGILAVLAAIAIPSVAGLIDRANVSADNANADEMTNAIQRFASEYELYCQDIASGKIDFENLDSAQSRVYNTTGIKNRKDIEEVEKHGKNSVIIDSSTKYPQNLFTAKKIIENYMKTSSETFQTKQSDKQFYLSPDIGVVVVDDIYATYSSTNKKVFSNTDGNGNELSFKTEWINLSSDMDIEYIDYDVLRSGGNIRMQLYFYNVKNDNGKISILHNGEYKKIESSKVLLLPKSLIPAGKEFDETVDKVAINDYAFNASSLDSSGTQLTINVNITKVENYPNRSYCLRVCMLTDTGEKIYTQCIYGIYGQL